MKEDRWSDCLKTFSSRRISPDMQKAKSLMETANDRIIYINKDLNEKTANFIFEDYYTSILELAQAFLFLEGYNISNHICIGFYLRDVLKREELFRIFDDLRFKKNSLVYYGKRMDLIYANWRLAVLKN